MRKLAFISSFLLTGLYAHAQMPMVCATGQPPADNCINACINCDFNGYTGSTIGFTPDGGQGFCGSVENDQWLGFIAGAGSATFTVTTFGCLNNNGVQIALYPACGLDPIICNGGSLGGGNTPLNINSALTPGASYFLMIDGYLGDQCSFNVSVSPPGAAMAPPIGNSIGSITGPVTICPGATVQYSIPTVTNAGVYTWTVPTGWLVNGLPGPLTVLAPGGKKVQITAGNVIDTSFQICVKAGNACYPDGPATCKTVRVEQIPLTVLAPVDICFADTSYTLPWGEKVSVSGTYQAVLQSYQGCDSMVQQMVRVKSPITITLPDKTLCQGECINICGTDYCTSGSFQAVCSSIQGCDSTIQFSLQVLEPIAHINGGRVLDCNNTSLLLTADTSSPGTIMIWKSLAGQILGNDYNYTVSATGTYILTATIVEDGVQCSAADTIVITSNTTAPTLTADSGNLTCTINSVLLSALTNATNPTYTWTGPNGFSSDSLSPSVTVPGTYFVTVTDSINGCTTSTTVTVSGDLATPNATTAGGIITCTQGTVTITGSTSTAGSLLHWNGPGGFQSSLDSVSVNTVGDYILTVTAPNGCSSTSIAQVTPDIDLPNAVAQGGTLNCMIQAVTLEGSTSTPNTAYIWNGPNGFNSNLLDTSVSNEGVYTFYVTNIATGCTAQASAFVYLDTAPPDVLTTGATITCTTLQPAIKANALTNGVAYFWIGPHNFSSDVQNPIVSEIGDYFVTVTDPSNGCTASSAVTVIQDITPPMVTAEGGTLTCGTTKISLNGHSSSANALFQWLGPFNFKSTQVNPVVSVDGMYTLTVTALNGCTQSTQATVLLDLTPPGAEAQLSNNLDCTHLNASLTAVPLNGNESFAWTGPNNYSANTAHASLSFPGIYQLIVTGANGCKSIDSVTVLQDIVSPTVIATGGTIDCFNKQVNLMSSAQNNGVNYDWTGPASFSSSLPDPSVSMAGIYTVVATGANGCTASAEVIVLQDLEVPSVNISGGLINCVNPSITLYANTSTSVSWQWSGPDSFSSSQQNPLVSLPGNYKVVATASNGCSSSSTLSVLADIQSPILSILSPYMLNCTTSQVELKSTMNNIGSYTYQWTTLNGHIIFGASTANAMVNQAGIYQLLVTNLNNGCTCVATEPVFKVDDMPNDAEIQGRGVSCYGDTNGSASIGAISGGTPPFVFSLDKRPFGPDSVFTALKPGAHSLVIQDIKGCEYETSFDISEPDEIRVNLGQDTTIHLGEPILISLDHIVNFQGRLVQTQLSPTELPIDSAYVPTYSVHYKVTVVDSNGCKASDERLIAVDRARWVYIPNVFTPGSSENYILTIYGGNDVERIKSFLLFDRWGNVLHEAHDFEKNDLNKGWDGIYRGQAVNPGVYSYYAEVLFKDGETVLYKGDVTLIR